MTVCKLIRLFLIALLGSAAWLAPLDASASFVTFYGLDQAPGVGGPHPNSDAAHAAFLAQLAPATVGVETFEGDVVASFNSRAIGFPTTSVTGVIQRLGDVTRIDGAPAPPNWFAISGANYLFAETDGNESYFELTLSSTQTGFGFYGVSFSDYQGVPGGSFPPIEISLDGGDWIDVVNINPSDIAGGSINFFGVVSDTPFTTLWLRNPPGALGDGIALDDMTIGQTFAAAAVPEPPSLVYGLAGLVALLCLRRVKRRTTR